MRRRVTALLAGALAVLAITAAPASALAQPGAARAPTVVTSPASPSLPASALSAAPAPGSQVNTGGNGFALSLASGASKAQTLVLTNNTNNEQLTIGVQSVDATRTGANTAYSIKATDSGSGSWVEPTVGVGVIGPGESMNVPFTVSVPQDAPAGAVVVAGLAVNVQRADPVGAGVPTLANLPSLHVPVEMSVAGTPAPVLSITSVKAKTMNGATYLAVTVHNAGSVETNATGTITTPGSTSSRPIRLSVPGMITRTVYVPWQTINAALGASIDIELNYGQNDVASWLGTVAPDGKAPTTVTSVAPDGTTTTVAAPASSGHSLNWLWWVLAVVIGLLLLGALAFLGNELLRGGSTTRMPIDVGSLPPLQVTMDPAHTEVLNALVTQVGVLGNAIGHLADRVGVPVAVPPGPPLLTPGTQRRQRRHASSRVHHNAGDEIVVQREVALAPPPPPPAGASSPPLMTPPRFAREVDDIALSLQDLREVAPNPPRFYAPPPLGPHVVDDDVIAPVPHDMPAFIAPPPAAPRPPARGPEPIAHDDPTFIAPPSPAPEAPAAEPAAIAPAPPRFIPPPAAPNDAWPSDDDIEAYQARQQDRDDQ